ncbi:MAG TPA: ATP-binding cassette domain-containing protein [Candidatus Brocadiia bacterium]|nr:ATP-binding cassette domain-containing protein [Candidatus Brocadiia bacterium]
MIRKELPKSVNDILRKQGVPEMDVLLTTDSEIDELGRYGKNWFVMTDEKIMTFSQKDGHARVLRTFEVDKIEEARLNSCVGSGFLEVKINGSYEEVIRFLNSDAQKFGRIVQKINGTKKGVPIRITEEDSKDERRCISCGRMLSGTKDVCPRCISKGRTMRRLFGLAKPYLLPIFFLLVMMLGNSVVNLLPGRIWGFTVATITGKTVEDRWGLYSATAWFEGLSGLHKQRAMLAILVAATLTVTIIQHLIHIANGLMSTWVGAHLTYDLRRQLYRRLQDQSVAYYDKNQAGSLMTRIMQDVEGLHGFIVSFTTTFLNQIFVLGMISFALIRFNKTMALYALFPVPFVVSGTYLYSRFLVPHIHRFYERRSKLSNILYASLSGVRVVKAFGQENREHEQFDNNSGKLRGANMTLGKASSIFNPVMGFVFGLGGLIVNYTGGVSVINGAMPLEDFITFLSYVGMFYGPIGALSQFNQQLAHYMTAAHRVFEVMDAEPEIGYSSDNIPISNIRGEIEFEHVTFGYDPLNPILKDVSFKIQAGEMIGIVGRSGSGKTTVVNLICRFYEPQDGTIKIDGVDLKDIRQQDLRKAVGLVLQEPYLFRGTIAENVAYGKPGATFEEVIEAANAAYVHHSIMRFRDGYDTLLGDGGGGMSGGERQRVSIARAILYDPNILILDEATSSVDTESEREIQKALESIAKNRTTIAIAHRLSTLRNANRIIVMDEGKIAEMGTHAELMKLEGLYHKLVKIQTQLSEEKQTVDRLKEEMEEDAKEKARLAKEKEEASKEQPKEAAKSEKKEEPKDQADKTEKATTKDDKEKTKTDKDETNKVAAK